MFFAGDISLPGKEYIPDIGVIQNIIGDETLFANIEGPILKVNNTKGLIEKKIIFNTDEAVKKLINDINLSYINVTNNHIHDYKKGLQLTQAFAKENDLVTLGDKKDFIFVRSKSNKFMMNGFGWNAINCKSLANNFINIIQTKTLYESISHCRGINKNEKIVVYLHWGIELEKLPTPYMRRIAHECIDHGANLVIGSHSHCVQSIEEYKDQPIIYGMGNFLYPEGVYWNGELKYNEFSKFSLLLEYDDNVVLHLLRSDEKKVSFLKSSSFREFDDDTILNLTAINESDYKEMYKELRIKSPLLPIFNYNDNSLTFKFKSLWLILRHKLIILVKKLITCVV